MKKRSAPSLAFSRLLGPAALVGIATFALPARGAPTKEECTDAHGRAQDQREEGHLVRAQQTFLTCAQPACPQLVQADCARFAEELGALVPTVSFAARDSHAADLPSTQVYVDDQLRATRLDDGKTYELDPGKHVVRFVHDGKEIVLRVVLSQGERGRNLVATFLGAPEPAPSSPAPIPARPPELHRPLAPLFVSALGGAALATGAVFVGVGLGRVPTTCSTSTRECAAPQGDKAFDDAHGGITLANAGVAIGVAGAVIAIGGLVWYFAQSPSARVGAAAPTWHVAANGGGFSF